MLVRLLKDSVVPSGTTVDMSEEQAALFVKRGAAVPLPPHESGKGRLEQDKMVRNAPHNKGGA